MRRISLLALPVVILGVAFVVGCAARPEVTPGAPPPTPVVRVGAAGDGQDADTSAVDLASRFPLAVPAADAEDVSLDDSQCIDCHTDDEAVQDLAVEPEEEEQLSEGEG